MFLFMLLETTEYEIEVAAVSLAQAWLQDLTLTRKYKLSLLMQVLKNSTGACQNSSLMT